MTTRNDWINARAYALWEQDGRTHGKDADHWSQAAEEYEQLQRTKASTDGAEILEQRGSKDD